MMFSDDEIKESSLTRPGDEIISIREVCIRDKFDKNAGNSLLLNSNRNELEVPRPCPDFSPPLDQRFAWTEEDGIAALVSEGFAGHGLGMDGFQTEMKVEQLDEQGNEAEPSSPTTSSRTEQVFSNSAVVENALVSSTSSVTDRPKRQGACKVDKADPRSRLHFVKYVKRHGRTFKLWECGICGREFQHQYTLMRHLPTHTDERNFHCDVCGKSFRQLSTLSQHRAIHSALRPYACEVCDKTFNRVSTLISHRKTHSKEKPYRCHWCPKGFHQKGNLRNHLFTHTNERPYRCNICNKGFNQQSNLVCHKIKAHPGATPKTSRWRTTPRIMSKRSNESQPDSTRPQTDQQCEVSSSVGPYIRSSIESPSSDWSKSWDSSKSIWPNNGPNFGQTALANGVIVDQIKTYHMNVALATHQTPFALLKPDNGTPVLVKVVDTKLPGGKQMLVPATAEDLRVGGKIVVNNENQATNAATEALGAVQIRVPVVATVVPKINSGGRLHLSVEEPHHAYHTALSADVGEVNVEPCTGNIHRSCLENLRAVDPLKDSRPGCSSRALPPPSPPLDLISLDLFEPMECIPMGPQITPVGNIDQPPNSDEGYIFIGKFEDSIPLSDSD